MAEGGRTDTHVLTVLRKTGERVSFVGTKKECEEEAKRLTSGSNYTIDKRD